jgi:Chaperone of endosialidase
MPVVGDKVIRVGVRGPVGATGGVGQIWQGDPPADNTTYGRYNGGWLPVLPLTGGTLAGGIVFTNRVASSPSDTGAYLSIYSNMGVCVTNNTLNYYTTSVGQGWRGVCESTPAFRFGYGGDSTARGISFDNTAYYPSISLNASLNYFFFYAGASNYFEWTPTVSTMRGGNNGVLATGEKWLEGVGVRPYTTTYTNGNNWRWDGTWMLARIDNSVEWAIATQCDERMKQDIAPSTFDALETIKKIRLYQYRWLDHKVIGRPKSNKANPIMPIGFVAQRLNEDFPYAVKSGGKKVFGAVLMWSTDPHTMLATLCRAVQQLDERMQVLRSLHA